MGSVLDMMTRMGLEGDDAEAARKMFWTQIGAGLMGAVRPGVRGGIDMSSIGSGFTNAMKSATTMRDQLKETAFRNRQQDSIEGDRQGRADHRAAETATKGKAASAKLARASEITGRTVLDSYEADRIISESTANEFHIPTPATPHKARSEQGGIHGISHTTAEGSEFVPLAEGAEFYQAPSTSLQVPYITTKANEEGGHSTYIVPKGGGDPQEIPLPNSAGSTAELKEDSQLRQLRSTYQTMANEYRRKYAGIMAMPEALRAVELAALEETYNFPPGFDPLDPQTHEAALLDRLGVGNNAFADLF